MTVNIQDKIFGMSSGAREVVRCLFFHGPTWDGNIPDKNGRGELCRMGFAHHEFGWAWLTREGVKFALESLDLERAKEKWQHERSRAVHNSRHPEDPH